MTAKRCLVALLVLIPSFLLAQGSSTSSSHLKIPLNARSAALGEATVSDAGQFSSWLLNPANLYSRESFAVALTHSQWLQDMQSEFIGTQIPVSIGTVGVAVSTTSVPGIEIREKPGPAVGTFSARFASLQLGYAGSPSDDIVLGASAKYLYEKLYTEDATGLGFDVGMLYHTPIHGLQAGASVTNIGSLQEFRNDRSDLPTFARVGASYFFAYDEFAFSVSAAMANNLQHSEKHAKGSIEATYSSLVTLRFGYESGYDSRGLTAGLGVRYEFVQFDYAYVPFSLGLGDGHFFSLGFHF